MITEKTLVLRLIQLYKEMPYLWNKEHQDYKNRQIRNQGHRTLLEAVRELDPGATLKTSKKKIENLRTNYIKELKKVLDAQRTNSFYEPSLYYFKEMEFLNDHTDTCITSPRDRESLDREMSHHSSADTDYQKAYISSTQNKPYPASNIPLQDSRIDNPDNENEKWETIGRSIGLQLRDMNHLQRTVAHKLINDVMYYAECGLLSHNASVSLDQYALKTPSEDERDTKEHIVKIHDGL